MGNGYPCRDSVKGWGTDTHHETTGIHPEGRGMVIHPEAQEKGEERVFTLILRRGVENGYPSWESGEGWGTGIHPNTPGEGRGTGIQTRDSGKGWKTGIHAVAQ